MATSSAHRWSPPVPRRWVDLVGAGVLVVVLGSGVWITWSTLFVRTWRDPDAVKPAPSSTAFRETAASLTRRGVLLRPPVRRSLNELVDVWLRRTDLQRMFRTADGLPDVQRLLAWVGDETDSSSVGLLDDRGNLTELAGRMGILPVSGNPLQPIVWTIRNRVRPMYPAGGIPYRLVEIWHERPDVAAQYTVDGRVDVRGLLFWGASLGPDDASYQRVSDIKEGLQQLLDELGG